MGANWDSTVMNRLCSTTETKSSHFLCTLQTTDRGYRAAEVALYTSGCAYLLVRGNYYDVETEAIGSHFFCLSGNSLGTVTRTTEKCACDWCFH